VRVVSTVDKMKVARGRLLQQANGTPVASTQLGATFERLIKGWVAEESGRFDEAAQEYRRAYEDTDEPWLLAATRVAEHRNQTGAAERARHLEELGAELEVLGDSKLGHCLRCARAEILLGLGLDDVPAGDDIERAREDLERVREKLPRSARVRLLEIRARKCAVRYQEDRVLALQGYADCLAQAEADLAGGIADDCDWGVGFDPVDLRRELGHARGYLHLMNRQWLEALDAFSHVLTMDPGHQAALAWSVFCRRVLEQDMEALVLDVTSLLRCHDVTRDTVAAVSATRGRPVVVHPEFVAELLTERAALAEDQSAERAFADYKAARELRPRMWFAYRGELRCLMELVDVDEAERLADDLVARVIREADERRIPWPPEVLVTAGLIKQANGKAAGAIELYDQAIAARPAYGYAYEAKIAARRQRGESELALAEGISALDQRGDGMYGANSIRVALGQTHLERRETRDAIAQFQLAVTDSSPGTRDLARGGLIAAYLRARRFDLADELWQSETQFGVRALDAGAWLSAELGDFAAALKHLNCALLARPRDIALIAGKAGTLRLIGHPADAKRFISAVASDHTGEMSYRLHNELGWIALDLGELVVAREHFDAAIEREPRFEPAHRGRVTADSRSGVPVASIEQWIDAVSQQAHDSDYVRAILFTEAAVGRLRCGDLVGARAWLAGVDAGGRPLVSMLQVHELIEAGALLEADAALEQLEREDFSSDVDDPRVLLLRARLHLVTGNAEEAMSSYGAVAARWPRWSTAKCGWAMAHVVVDELEPAVRLLEEVVAAQNLDLQAHEELAAVLVRVHENEHGDVCCDSAHLRRAAQLCEHVRDQDPGRPTALGCAAVICALRGHIAAADLYAQHAVESDPDNWQAQLTRAALHLRFKRPELAVECVRPLHAIRPAAAAAAALEARAREELGDSASALPLLKRAVALHPSDWHTQVELVQTLQRLERTEEALDTIARAFTAIPRTRHSELHLARARALYDLGTATTPPQRGELLNDALTDVEAAARLAGIAPRKPRADIHYHRGVLLHALGRQRGAQQEFHRCQSLDGDHVRARQALQLLTHDSSHEADERMTRRFAYLLGGLAITLIGAVMVIVLTEPRPPDTAVSWSPAAWIIGTLLILLVVAGSLPRLAGLKFGTQVELSIHAASNPSEPVQAVLRLAPLQTLPASLLAGPGSYRSPEPRDERI
jgi:tetratricopeptide (TPR) repeat protein